MAAMTMMKMVLRYAGKEDDEHDQNEEAWFRWRAASEDEDGAEDRC